MNGITRIFDLLYNAKEKYKPGQPILYGKKNGLIYTYDVLTYKQKSIALAAALLGLGIRPGDKIAVIINNRPEWNIFDMAIMLIGAIQVPIYPNLSGEQFHFIFNDAEIAAIVVNDNRVWGNIEPSTLSVPSLRHLISIDPAGLLITMDRLLQSDTSSWVPEVEKIAATIQPSDLFAIIYTSGTTGRPKGVMLSHNNVVSNFTELSEILRHQPAARAVSMLPLCHIYERVLNYVYQNSGTAIWYVDGFENLRENLHEANADIFCAVPRLIEKLYDSILTKGRDLKGFKRYVFYWSLSLAQRYEPGRNHSLYYLIKLAVAHQLVFSKWHEALGKNLVSIVSGGATLNPKITSVFWAAGFKVMEGYGLTETSPVVAVSNFRKGGVRIGTVGPILPGVEVAFTNEGEILVRGPGVMLGYYKRPERTAEVLDEGGWFHTGDIGHLVDDKYLKITDRKKEIFKTSGGKYIAPQVIENYFKASNFIEHIMVVGENRKHPSALIVPAFNYLKSWCEVKEIPYSDNEEMMRNSRILNRFEEEINEFNQHFARHEQIKKWEFILTEWSVESGELSPTLKLRRKYLVEKYKDLIEAMYTEP